MRGSFFCPLDISRPKLGWAPPIESRRPQESCCLEDLRMCRLGSLLAPPLRLCALGFTQDANEDPWSSLFGGANKSNFLFLFKKKKKPKHAPAGMEVCVISVPMDDAKRQMCQPFSKDIQRFADHAGASVQCAFHYEKTARIRLIAGNISVSTFQINARAGGRAKERRPYLGTFSDKVVIPAGSAGSMTLPRVVAFRF